MRTRGGSGEERLCILKKGGRQSKATQRNAGEIGDRGREGRGGDITINIREIGKGV